MSAATPAVFVVMCVMMRLVVLSFLLHCAAAQHAEVKGRVCSCALACHALLAAAVK